MTSPESPSEDYDYKGVCSCLQGLNYHLDTILAHYHFHKRSISVSFPCHQIGFYRTQAPKCRWLLSTTSGYQQLKIEEAFSDENNQAIEAWPVIM